MLDWISPAFIDDGTGPLSGEGDALPRRPPACSAKLNVRVWAPTEDEQEGAEQRVVKLTGGVFYFCESRS